MNITFPLILSTISGLSTIVGCLFMFIKVKNVNKFITFCLSISLMVMLFLSIFELIPQSLKTLYIDTNLFIQIPIIILIFIMGIILVNIIENKISNNNNSLYKLGILNMLALIMHNVPEGIVTFLGSIENPKLGIKISTAILFHNIPEGISIAIPIYYATNNKKKAFLYTFLSGISEPIGGLISYIFLKEYISSTLISYILVLVSGIMITLAINNILPKCLDYKENKWLYIGLLTGLLLSILNIFIL